jgi:hypothetical protein
MERNDTQLEAQSGNDEDQAEYQNLVTDMAAGNGVKNCGDIQ